MEQIPIIEQLSMLVRSARLGDYANAASQLNAVLQLIQKRLSPGNGLPAESVSKLAYSLETLHMQQAQQDWVAFADVLEYEFIPLWQDAEKKKD